MNKYLNPRNYIKSIENKLKSILPNKIYRILLFIKYPISTIKKTIKQKTVLAYKKKFNTCVFIETGTFLGDMIDSVKDEFIDIYSIELDEKLYLKAKDRFEKFNHIHLFNGDSGVMLDEIAPDINKKCLFWLDAHYSGPGTGRGYVDTPIVQELDIIANNNKYKSVILIDDARIFNGKNGYPTIRYLEKFVSDRMPKYTIEIKNDIIRICHI